MRGRVRLLSVLVAVAALVGVPSPARAAGTVAVTATEVAPGVTKYVIAWTSTAGGAVSANTFSVRRGEILQVKFVPNSGGTQPTDLYDVTLVDTDGVDLLGSEGANLSNAASAIGVPKVDSERIFVDGTQVLDLVVANAGSAKGGSVIVWMR